MPDEITLPRKRAIMYVIGFAFNLSYALPTYITSSFLAQFVPETLVGVIYTASSLLAIAAFIEISDVLRRFGNFKTTITLIILQIFSLIGLIYGTSSIAIIAAFILNFVSIALINFTLDVFLEGFSNDTRTGKIRGSFLTIINTAWLISPAIASWLVGINNFKNVYFISAVLLVPTLGLLYSDLKGIKEPTYSRLPFWKSFAEVWANKDIKGILLLQFLLQLFYAWMVIYTPLYLHEIVGFDWPTIGIIFTIMLAPFVILEMPLGRLADRNGEKTFLSIGFVIMAVSTGLIAFVTDHNALLWAAILFMTRVGAATVEVMTDTYFFKKVDASETNIISFFRTARPLAYIVGPILATILFTVFDTKGLFIFLGFLMLYGLRYSLTLKDAK